MEKAIEWKVVKNNSGDTVYPFRVETTDALDSDRIKSLTAFCRKTFGQSGRAEFGGRWSHQETGWIAFMFRYEVDMVIFVAINSGV
jgi:hypothetical protein